MVLDVVIVGAGVIGLACAERCTRLGMAAAVVERAGSFGTETSSRNSEVIHAGIYYEPGSLKAKLCVEGARALYAWCEAHRVQHRRIGKYIVGTSTDAAVRLERLRGRAAQNSVSDLTFVTASELRSAEPNVRAVEALWSPSTGIVDSHGFMASLLAGARERGCYFAWRHRVLGVASAAGGYELLLEGPSGEQQQVTATRVINAAGLEADTVASLACVDVDAAGYRQKYVKGNYFRVNGPALVNHLIYPLPPPDLQGLGIHLTVGLDGSNRLGPDVEPLPDRAIDYRVDEVRAGAFIAAASTYLVGLAGTAVSPDQAGVRPKLVPTDGRPRDFIIAEESSRGLPRWVNLIGIESPGLTSSLAIARLVVDLLG